jgi:NAD+ synthase (glutamine-hydrolysing)
MKIAVYQGRFPIGKMKANCERILKVAHEAIAQNVELLVFPECALSGYAAQDLFFQEDFKNSVIDAIEFLRAGLPRDLWVIVGTPIYEEQKIFNALLVFHAGKIEDIYNKRALPNHDVFDERRYFRAGDSKGVIKINGLKIGLLVCYDFWKKAIIEKLPRGLDLVIAINASPFFIGKRERRVAKGQVVATTTKAPFLYVHQVGAQDEIIFDGASFILDKEGKLLGVLPQFAESLGVLECGKKACQPGQAWQQDFTLQGTDELYQALVFALREYVYRNGFKGVLIGLSGGVDSAVTLALAVAALGAENVEVILMPSRFTQAMSIEDARQEADTLKVKAKIISIEFLFNQVMQELSPYFGDKAWDITEENIQARLRGMTLMALSNKYGKMVIATTNKSELSVGYGTLYGDLIGGFALLKDVYKTEVYQLAKFINREQEIIPERVLTRAPSAELRDNQKDQDSLPDYAMLDAILKLHVEENLGVATIVQHGFPEKEVARVIQMVDKSEYKRQQAPIGPKVSTRAFGKDWRIPVTRG